MVRPTRAFLLTGLVVSCLLLHCPPYREHADDELIDPQTARWRWIDSGLQVVRAAALTPNPAQRFGPEARFSDRELDRMVQKLKGAVLENPADAATRSNLAYMLTARARQQDRPEDFIEALEQLELAAETAPNRPEVLYNRALSLTGLELRAAARLAWGRYLEVDPRSPTAAAARLWSEQLREPTLSRRWEREGKAALLRAAETGDIRLCASLVASYSIFARLWIEEELLSNWAKAAPAEATPQMNALQVLAGALVEAIHDHTVEDTLAGLDGMPVETRELLREGLRSYGEAMRAYRAFGPEQKKYALLERAAGALEGAGSPLSGWARFYRAVGWSRVSPATARSQLTKLAETTPPDRQPVLYARIEWMLGTTEEIQNRYERALEHYTRSREYLSVSEGPQAAAFMDLLIAEARSKLGEIDRSWASRIAALRGLAPGGDRQRLHATLYSTVEQLLHEQRFAAGRPWIEELETNAARWKAAPGLAEAALQKGRFLAERGRSAEAEETFRRAREAAARIEDASVQLRIIATIDLYEGESLLETAPRIATTYLGRARTGMLEIGYRFQLPRIDAARARAALALGDRAAAMAALRLAIAEEEAIRRDVRDEARRASAFEGAQLAFDSLVELELDSPDGDARAFGYAEQCRARVLFDLLAVHEPGLPGLDGSVSLDRLVTELPDDIDLLELAVLPRQTVGWWVRQGEVRRFATKITARELARRLDQLRGAIARDAPEVTIQAKASELWRVLIGPIAGELEAGRRLVVVPDRFLGRLPFGVLFDPGRRRYLLEDHEITVAPSASAFLLARARRRALGNGPPSSVVAAGANHPEEIWLSTVESEAKSIGALYPEPQVLTREAATRAAFLATAQHAEVLHFAGHGKDESMSYRRSRLFFQPEGLGDSGVLFGEELAAGHFPRARLAVLAACRSVNAGAPGRETVSGLAAAFLAAGVPTVVASLWDAEDRPTGDLMIAFHSNLRRGLTPGESLRRAQMDMLRPGSRFRSPRYWAGFLAVGAE